MKRHEIDKRRAKIRTHTTSRRHGMSWNVGQMSWLLLQQLPDVAQHSNFQLLSFCQKTLRYVWDGHQHAWHIAHIEAKAWRLYAIRHCDLKILKSSTVILFARWHVWRVQNHLKSTWQYEARWTPEKHERSGRSLVRHVHQAWLYDVRRHLRTHNTAW